MPFATSQIARVSEETWTLLLKQNRKRFAGLAAMLIVASALAYGNSVASADSEPPLISERIQGVVAGVQPAISWEEFAGFRSTLHNAHKDNVQLFMATANRSGFSDKAQEQESTIALPEPGTGILLSIGLFAASYRRGRAPAIKRLH